MKLSLIAIILSFSAMAYGQGTKTSEYVLPDSLQSTIPDTITLSVTHQTLLPQLMSQQAWLTNLKQPGALDAAIADVAEKINILLTGYIEPDKIQGGKIQLGKEGKLIVQ